VKSLAPGFLIAMPQIDDPNFRQAVVLMIEHSETGSMGIVINRAADITFSELAKNQSLEVSAQRRRDVLHRGGPVEPQRGFVLHDSAQVSERHEISSGLYLSMTGEALAMLLKDSEANVRFCLGYAGWDAGQIENELQEGAWLFCEVSRDLVLEAKAETIWESAIKEMGIEPGRLVSSGGRN
jgi:putative transcriptional regulator